MDLEVGSSNGLFPGQKCYLGHMVLECTISCGLRCYLGLHGLVMHCFLWAVVLSWVHGPAMCCDGLEMSLFFGAVCHFRSDFFGDFTVGAFLTGLLECNGLLNETCLLFGVLVIELTIV